MIFTSPFVLIGLAALPALYLLLRLYPPAARRIKFPPIVLLKDLSPEQRTPHRIPFWILLLRLVATALLIVGLAGPSLHPPATLPGTGPILLVIDNGWAAAADWPQRIAAARRILAAGSARGIAILATAPDTAGNAPHIQGLMTITQAAQIIDALQPQPWPVDRRAAAFALQAAPPSTRVYIADGITDGPDFPSFMKALRPNRIISGSAMPALLASPRLTANGAFTIHLIAGPADASLLARDSANEVLARAKFNAGGDAVIALPLPLANKITALTLDGAPTAGSTALLNASSRSALVGLSSGSAGAETPFLGTLYFARRALPPGAGILTGNLTTLIADKANPIILADTPLTETEQFAANDFLSGGGVLLRFAGPLTAGTPDPLSPDPLLAGDRRLGGTLSWTKPLPIAPFPVNSPFAGLPPDPAAIISRQVLADPSTLDPATIWATLNDGTPLVLGKPIGKGYLVSVLTTANADWSNLALSGLYPAMLARLIDLGRGAPLGPNIKLPIHDELSAFGALSPATGPATINPASLAATLVSPAHPAGLYGTGSSTVALNLGGHIVPPVPANLQDAAPLNRQLPPLDLGPFLIAAAFLLLVLDLTISLFVRGLMRLPHLLLMACVVLPFDAQAQTAALQTQIGYVRTNDPATDQISADGLAWLSADVSAHTSAQLGNPAGLDPAVDDLAFYPLIYWPVLSAAPALAPAACTALNTYMARGGLLVIDQPGSDAGAPGSGAGFAPGAAAALTRVTACLNRPPLEPLTTSNILARCFYIIPDFAGRFTGAPVLIATPPARDADGVTPLIIGQNDWAAAWARDAAGDPEQTPIPGADEQRVIADRFGTNLVIYALTGSYKADQSNIPKMLDKLGQ